LFQILLINLLLASVVGASELVSAIRHQASGICTRFAVGSIVQNPPDLYASNGVLRVNLSYNHDVDSAGRDLFCFTTRDGEESPTLHVAPGDQLVMKVTNDTTTSASAGALRMTTSGTDVCGDPTMGPDSVNVHFHGTNTSPVCHQDEVIHTLINPGETFTYNVRFPLDEPPGLYWYHPHVHGLAERAVQGGASGAIVVHGLARVPPSVAGLAERIFVIRDQNVVGRPHPGGPDDVPSWDVSLNFVPAEFPDYQPGIIQMKPGERQLWRVANASADTIMDLQLQYDGVPQTLEVSVSMVCLWDLRTVHDAATSST
jgi:FtsP/CotA-like multicopper oxidase with cupredoxin domain